jgi:Glycosyl transferase family 2
VNYSTTATIAGWTLCTFWAFFLIPIWYVIACWRLTDLARRIPSPQNWPLVSIIVPARDEEAMINTALTSLLNLDYPRLEIIAVNDRSTDQTGSIMDRLAQQDARLRVLHIHDLPAGWLGKNHAMHQGANAARGDWLLFTDGDIIFAPDAIRLSMQWVLHHERDHLCLNPELIGGGYWERAMVCCFGLLFFAGFLAWAIPTRWKRAYCGIGAFNLLRHAVYREIGGFEQLKMDVLDDVHLGKMIKHAGYRQQFLLGKELVRVRWQPSFWGVVRGLEKNSFAALHYSVLELIATSGLLLAITLAPYWGASCLPLPEAAGWITTIVLMHATYAYLGHQSGSGIWLTPVLPGMLLMFIFVMWRSAVITLRQGGVRWRETFYPLDELRRQQLR